MSLVQYDPSQPSRVRPYDGAWRAIGLGVFVGVGLLGSLVTWAALSILPAAAVTEGVVVVEGSRRPLQNRDGGIVDSVLTTEGAFVKRGDPLIRLDLNELAAEVDILTGQLDQALAVQARFRAEADGADAIAFPKELLAKQAAPEIAVLLDQQRELFAARLDGLHGSETMRREKISGLETQIRNSRARIAETDRQIASIEEELGGLRDLLAQQLTEKSRVTTLERQSASLAVDRGALESDVSVAENAIAGAKLEIEQLQKTRREEIAKGLADTEAQISDLRPKLRAATERVQQAEIVAPIDGYVLNLAVHGAGATLAPGQVALEIVPDTDALVLKVKIAPQDIEQLREGQRAELHFAVAKSRYQKSIAGTLLKISADRKIDEGTKAAYYEATVAIDRAGVADAGITLLPGMSATAAIVTGERTVLRYFVDPILDVASVAMRES